MKLKDKLMPTLVLTIICIVISALVIGVHKLTYVDNTGVLTTELKSGFQEIFGKDISCEMLIENKDGTETAITYDGITSVLVNKEENLCAFEIISDGYQKSGIHVLIGINSDGETQGVSFIEITETKGIGTKIEEKSYLAKFLNLREGSAVDEVDDITGATYSSKGVKSAVKLALSAYDEHKEAIFGE